MKDNLRVPKAPGYNNKEFLAPQSVGPETPRVETSVLAPETSAPEDIVQEEQTKVEQTFSAPSAPVQPLSSVDIGPDDRPIPYTNFVQAEAMIGRDQESMDELAGLGDIYNFDTPTESK